MKIEALKSLDLERQMVPHAELVTGDQTKLVKVISADRSHCEIVYSSCPPEVAAEMIQREKEAAIHDGYELEWKVYGHDLPACLKDKLLLAGFTPEPIEQFMVHDLDPVSVAAIRNVPSEIRKITDRSQLADLRPILQDTGRANINEYIERFAYLLDEYPEKLSVYIAFLNGIPVACGRIYFHDDGCFAELCGGTTKVEYRKRGLYSSLVRVRLLEALDRKCKFVCVDALPTSEPILQTVGFKVITDTRPFIYQPDQTL